jgi:FlaA1/EpsC-like NDP-sugar epimerase
MLRRGTGCSHPLPLQGRALSHERLASKRVLITVAGGSIGSALHTVQEQMGHRPSMACH